MVVLLFFYGTSILGRLRGCLKVWNFAAGQSSIICD